MLTSKSTSTFINKTISTSTFTNVCSGASPDNTIVPPASAIYDNVGNVWTLNSGYIYINGIKRTETSNVVELYWHNHTNYVGNYGSQPGEITQKNNQGQYFKSITSRYFNEYIKDYWIPCVDPSLGGTSADGTTLIGTAGTYIIDKACNTWTLSNGYIYRKKPTDTFAIKDPFMSNVSLLLWYGGLVYHRNTNEQYYVLPNNDLRPQLITQHPINAISPWLPCTDPRIPKATNAGSFYGMNGHGGYPIPPFSPATVVSLLKELGCTIYRTNVWADPIMLTPVVNLAKEFQSAGLKIFPVLDYPAYSFNNGTTKILYPDEETAYRTLKADAAAVATALMPYGIDTYECGNELTLESAIRPDRNKLGAHPTDFNNTNWPIMRGVMRGLIDGIRSVQPEARCGLNFILTDIAAADMLWDGKQPDGTSGYPQVRWNFTSWHTYGPYGHDIFNRGIGDSPDWELSPGINIPVYSKARYGVPFFITEWNAQEQFSEFYNDRKNNAIESTMLYELTGRDTNGPWWGILYGNLTKYQPMYDAFQNFTKTHPDI
uniref:Glycoside hydrolase family 5 domain-containing protein n=1 Tax=Acrobeloides nanus TaxID=290746 RepID=A0A914E2B3_9BILA